jgi:hypothetical protein
VAGGGSVTLTGGDDCATCMCARTGAAQSTTAQIVNSTVLVTMNTVPPKVPSRIVLEFDDATPGRMMLLNHAAMSID